MEPMMLSEELLKASYYSYKHHIVEKSVKTFLRSAMYRDEGYVGPNIHSARDMGADFSELAKNGGAPEVVATSLVKRNDIDASCLIIFDFSLF